MSLPCPLPRKIWYRRPEGVYLGFKGNEAVDDLLETLCPTDSFLLLSFVPPNLFPANIDAVQASQSQLSPLERTSPYSCGDLLEHSYMESGSVPIGRNGDVRLLLGETYHAGVPLIAYDVGYSSRSFCSSQYSSETPAMNRKLRSTTMPCMESTVGGGKGRSTDIDLHSLSTN